MPYTKKTTKPNGKRRHYKKVARFTKPSRSMPNSAKCVEFYDLGRFTANTAHEFSVAGIVPSNPATPTIPSRASIMAPAFGLYRIAEVMFTVTPTADTYTPDLAPAGDAAVEVPKLYWKVNRYGDAPVGFTATDMLSLGCKPVRLDDKTITIKYKPNVLLANAGAEAAGLAGGSGQVKMTPWVSTDAEADDGQFALSKTEHYGHLMFIECAAAGDGVPIVCEVQARVIYEFKNPRIFEGPEAAAQRATRRHIRHTIGANQVVQAGLDLSGNPLPSS